MLVPMAAKTPDTRALAPSPTATIEMTDATPMMTPSAVRKLRVLLRSSAVSGDGHDVGEVHGQAALAAMWGSCWRVRDDLAVADHDDARRVAGHVGLVRHEYDGQPAAPEVWKSAMTSTLVFVSRLPVGSSANMSLGSLTIARAMATRCC